MAKETKMDWKYAEIARPENKKKKEKSTAFEGRGSQGSPRNIWKEAVRKNVNQLLGLRS